MTVEMICKIAPYDYWVVCKRFESGHRAGYVGIPDGHPLFGRDVDWPALRQMNTPLGQITYAASKVGGWEGHPKDELRWWFGIDNMHEDEPEDSMADVLSACFALARELRDYGRERKRGTD